jgi:hypothetical protein
MQITRSALGTGRGPSDWFTGDAHGAGGLVAGRRRQRPLRARRPHRVAHPPARLRRSGSSRGSGCASAQAARSR